MIPKSELEKLIESGWTLRVKCETLHGLGWIYKVEMATDRRGKDFYSFARAKHPDLRVAIDQCVKSAQEFETSGMNHWQWVEKYPETQKAIW